MDNWNYDMNDAPRGHYNEQTQIDSRGREVTRRVFIPDYIIVAPFDGSKPLQTWWSQESKRWVHFGTTELLAAWMHWPENPRSIEAKS